MRLRTLVVDDEELPRQRIAELARGHHALRVVGEAADGLQALDAIVALRPDLVFLDIRMPELDGLQVAAALDDEARLPAIVFITAHDDFALRAFELGAFDYLLKPVTQDRFDMAVARVIRRSAPAALARIHEVMQRGRSSPHARFVARRAGRHYFVPVADVHWLEAEGNYLRLHCAGATHLVRQTMKAVEAQLDADRFLRIHRSCIVAIDHIRTIEAGLHGEYVITLADASRHTSSRTFSPRVRDLVRSGGSGGRR